MKPLNLADDAPWKKRYQLPHIIFSQVAHGNPSRGVVVSNFSGINQVHAWDVESGEFRQITDKPAGVTFTSISVDGKYIYYLDDEDGGEVGHFVRVPFDGSEPEDITPDMSPYASLFFGQSNDGSKLGVQMAGEDGMAMYTITLEGDKIGQRSLVYKSQGYSYGPILSYDGNYAVIATTERSQHIEYALMAFNLSDEADQQKIKILEEEEGGINAVEFAPVSGDTRILATTSVTGFDRPLIWDVATGDRMDIPLLGLDGDFAAWGWSPDAKKILLRQIVQAETQLYIYDLETSDLKKLDHPSGTLHNGYFVNNDEIFVHIQNATTPRSIIALDTNRATNSATDSAKPRTIWQPDDVPESQLWRSVTFTAFDGQSIQAWLATPEGEGPFPTILHTHGGPTAVQTEIFHPEAQAWLDHGFAWMSVNYRGSTTFGRQFEHQIYGRLGYYEVADMVAARNYLVNNNIAKPDAIFPMGRSYGGYLTLLALVRKPDLWAGGLATVAIADWMLMYEDQNPTLRSYQHALFGGGPDTKKDAYIESSPVTYADDLKAPVYIFQGRNDSRCPARQMETFVDKLKSGNKAVEIHWFDAGHSANAVAENIHQMETALRWVYRILG